MREKRISRDEVYISDEAFFTGTAAEVVPIREYDSRIIGSGKRGPITTVLQAAYFDLVRGKNDKYQNWLAPVALISISSGIIDNHGTRNSQCTLHEVGHQVLRGLCKYPVLHGRPQYEPRLSFYLPD